MLVLILKFWLCLGVCAALAISTAAEVQSERGMHDGNTTSISDCGAIADSSNVTGCSTDINAEQHNAAKKLQSERLLYILSLLPYPDETFQPSWDEGPTLILAEQLAVELINNRSDILPGYTLQLLQGDSGCNIRSKANHAFFENVLYSAHAPLGIVGPGCSNSALTVSSLTGRKDLSTLTIHVAGSLRLSNRALYKYSFGTLDSTEVFVQASLALMRMNDWKSVTIMYDESREYYASTAREFERKSRDANIHHLTLTVYDTFIPLNVSVTSHNRVMFLLVGPDFLSKILCLAYHSNILYPIYQFIIVSRVIGEIQPVNFNYGGEKISCNEEQMRNVTNGILIMHYQLESNKNETAIGLTYPQFFETYKQLVSNYNRHREDELLAGDENSENEISPSFWVAAYFDAVWSMALALNSSLENTDLLNNNTGEVYGSAVADSLKESLLEQNFEGLSGRITYNKSSGYVIRDVNVYQINSSREMNLIAVYDKLNDSVVLTSTDGKFISATFRTESRILSVSLVAGAIFLSVTLIVFAITVILHILTVIYRHQKSVKASSIKLSHIAYIGCYFLTFASIVNFMVECLSGILAPSTECHLFHVLNTFSALGGTLLFGPICARTWRLYRIYIHFKNPGRLISDYFLLSVILILFLLDVMLAIIWVVADPFRYEYVPTEHLQRVVDKQGTTKEFVLIEEVIIECGVKTSYYLWFALLFMFAVLLMLIAFWLAASTRHIPHKDFQTHSVMFLVYLLSGFLFVSLFVYFVVLDNLLQFIVLSVVLNLTVFFSCLLLFLPPLYPSLKQKSLLSFFIKH